MLAGTSPSAVADSPWYQRGRLRYSRRSAAAASTRATKAVSAASASSSSGDRAPSRSAGRAGWPPSAGGRARRTGRGSAGARTSAGCCASSPSAAIGSGQDGADGEATDRSHPRQGTATPAPTRARRCRRVASTASRFQGPPVYPGRPRAGAGPATSGALPAPRPSLPATRPKQRRGTSGGPPTRAGTARVRLRAPASSGEVHS